MTTIDQLHIAANDLEPGSELHDAVHNLVSSLRKNYRNLPQTQLNVISQGVMVILSRRDISDIRKAHTVLSMCRSL